MITHHSLQNALFENKHLALCMLDNSGNIKAANHTFQQQFGELALGSSKPISIRSLSIWNQNLSNMDEAWEDLLHKGCASFSQNLDLQDGTLLHEIDLKQIDGTAEILMEFYPKQRVTEKVDKPAEAQDDLDNLASVISHDLRAPVANIAYLLSIFNEEMVDKGELTEFMGALKTSNERALRIIDEMGERVNIKLKKRSAASPSLHAMINSALEKFEEEISQTQARVVVDIQDHIDWKVPPGAFQMVLAQVISNSLKYRKENEAPKIIITCLRKKGDRIIEVKDNGLGFDVEENEHRLFGLFQTFHNNPDSRGIGLYQVKNRLLSIGGVVSLNSKIGTGTTVTLNFKQNELEEAPLYN